MSSLTCSFLADYAAWMLGCGATCIRIQKNVDRMAKAFGLKVELTIMPAHVQICVLKDQTEPSQIEIRRIRHTGISFHLNTQLSKLSWEVADGKVTFEEARQIFQRIIHTSPEHPLFVWIGASLANMAFCRLFGGDVISMLLVFAATLAGYRVKQELLERGVNIRFVFILSAFVSSVIASGGYVFGWGNTPDVALGTSVLYLIPGVLYISSVSDMLDKHYICAFSRFMEALILTACLSIGLSGGFLIMGLKMF